MWNTLIHRVRDWIRVRLKVRFKVKFRFEVKYEVNLKSGQAVVTVGK